MSIQIKGAYDWGMLASVTPLRVRGRRSPGGYGSSAPKPVTGQLGMHSLGREAGQYTVATLKGAGPKDAELLPQLYEPVLVTISANGLLLRGFESLDGASFVQEWHCEINGA